ncbi:MAG: hypothetical protein KDJ24_09015 [Gammaproteobacteria bacterium]|nr:hypothetical protein [Gammaproteobacteria bacterium]
MDDWEAMVKQRDELVRQYWESKRQTSWPVFQTLTSAQRRREYAKQDRLLDQYGEILPAVPVSRCPICGEVLSYLFDPFGLDGPWWHTGKLAEYALPEEPHFRLLQGGIDFHGRSPAEAEVHRTVRPGPGVPFVIPRLLDLPGMRAVLSSVVLPHGDTAYLTAYFSPDPIHGALLHQPWARIDYEVLDEGGENQGWGVANDLWDFELGTWIENGKLAWILPGDDTFSLHTDGPCPYLDLPGVRAPQSVERGKVSTLDLPTGEPPQPFD